MAKVKANSLEKKLNEIELEIIANIDNKKKVKELEAEKKKLLKELGRKP